LVPLIEAIENNLGRKPDQASADSGYCSESNLEALEAQGVDSYVAPGRQAPDNSERKNRRTADPTDAEESTMAASKHPTD
jgi:hypothetical protein